MAKTKKVNGKKLLAELVKDFGIEVNKENEGYAIAYIERHYQDQYDDFENGGVIIDGDMTPHEFAMATLANGFLDGEYMDGIEVTDLGNGLQLQVEKDQEIIEVSQDEVKKALKALLTKGADGEDKRAKFLAKLYEKHAEYNEEFFFGKLSYPLITIDKLNNRTLGNYTHGEDTMGITNHIRFNVNFIAMNTEERIFETLVHEMIHQWQDEVLYIGEDQKIIEEFKRYIINEEGKRVTVTERQKKRPKDWHNKDFKSMASVVGIPAIGDKCYGNPARMPEPKSYNRKFVCSCVASNGHPLTVWSTRAVNAVCVVCEKPFIEVPKNKGKVIKVEQSHVEKPGEDAVEEAHKKKYRYFNKFTSKDLKDEFIEHYNETEEHPMTEMVEGVYQKNHNAYKEGYTHWVAYNTSEVSPDAKKKEEIEDDKPKRKKKSKVEKPVDKKDNAGEEEPKKRGKKKMKVATKKPAKIVKPEEPKTTDFDYKNPKDLTELYKELGSIKAVADHFGKSAGTILYQAKKHGIDFNKIEVGVKS